MQNYVFKKFFSTYKEQLLLTQYNFALFHYRNTHTVTVDFQRDSTASTGAFEVVHEMPLYKSSAEYQNTENINSQQQKQQEKVKHEVIAAYNGCSASMPKNQVPLENKIEVPAVVEVVA